MQLLREVVEIFAAEYPEMMRQIEQAMNQADVEQLRKVSHKLKGSLLQFSAPAASGAAADLEHLATNDALEGARPVVQKLVAEVDWLMGMLRKMTSQATVARK